MTKTQAAERYLDGLESDYLREMQQCYVDFTKAESAVMNKYSRFKVGDKVRYKKVNGEETSGVIFDIQHDLMRRKCEMLYVFDLDAGLGRYESDILGLA